MAQFHYTATVRIRLADDSFVERTFSDHLEVSTPGQAEARLRAAVAERALDWDCNDLDAPPVDAQLLSYRWGN